MTDHSFSNCSAYQSSTVTDPVSGYPITLEYQQCVPHNVPKALTGMSAGLFRTWQPTEHFATFDLKQIVLLGTNSAPHNVPKALMSADLSRTWQPTWHFATFDLKQIVLLAKLQAQPDELSAALTQVEQYRLVD